MQQISDESELEKIVDKILADNTSQVDAYKSGKKINSLASLLAKL